MKLTKVIALILVTALMATLFAACGGGSTETDPPANENNANVVEPAAPTASNEDVAGGGRTEKLVVGTSSNFGSTELNAGNQLWADAVYECLALRMTLGGEPQMVMMKGYEKIDDVTYKITIYDYITDAEGNKIDAYDIEYCYTYYKEKGTSISAKYEYCKALSDYELEMKLASNSVGYFEECLKQKIVDSEVLKNRLAEFPANGTSCGTGPYYVSDYVSGASLTLTRREDYWQTDESLIPEYLKANVDEVVYQYIPEAAQLVIALESGTVDLALGLTGTNTQYFVGKDGTALDGYSSKVALSALFNAMILNMDSSSVLSDNLKLRQAILYAIDTNGLVSGVINGQGEACKALGCSEYGDFQEEWKNADYFDYDLEKAKQLLEESGFVQSAPLRIMIDTNGDRQKAAQIIQNYLLQIGIETEILSYDNALYNEYKFDPSQWEIMLDNYRSSDYMVNIWAHVFFYDAYVVGGATHLVDDNLVAMIKEASTAEGHTAENINKVNQYINDLACAIGTYDAYTYVIGREGINIFMDLNRVCGFPWACTFEEGFVSVAK